MTRRPNHRNTNPVFAIVCLGIKTEPLYFEQFKRRGLVLKIYKDKVDPDKIVRKAIKIKQEKEKDLAETCNTWVVFDKDDFHNFDQAISDAKRNNIEVAYSNPCFELWIFLHFKCTTACLSGSECVKKIAQCTSKKYYKNKIAKDLVLKLSIAIENAKKLEKHHDDNSHRVCSSRNPSSTVYALMEKIQNPTLSD